MNTRFQEFRDSFQDAAAPFVRVFSRLMVSITLSVMMIVAAAGVMKLGSGVLGEALIFAGAFLLLVAGARAWIALFKASGFLRQDLREPAPKGVQANPANSVVPPRLHGAVVAVVRKVADWAWFIAAETLKLALAIVAGIVLAWVWMQVL